MAPPSSGGNKGGKRGEVVQSKSPAEFFAENQNIAGFDNPGKALYTTIRELVENSLDAAESISNLPNITLTVEEMNETELNEWRGLENRDRIDTALFDTHKANKGKGKKQQQKEAAAGGEEESTATDGKVDAAAPANGGDGAAAKKKGGRGARSFYRVVCQDNGCGMQHDKIPDMLGRVLSGSKYGVRQTRGKFGLGSKMALIWSKKSTGLPIEIESAHTLDHKHPPSYLSRCTLDIDIYRNQPNVRRHEKVPNTEGVVGSKISVVVEGNWSTYRSHIMHYFQQLAIITPYAQFEVTYRSLSDSSKEFSARYNRRSEQMPPPTYEVKHHPSSVNHLIIQQLLKQTRTKTLIDFLCREFSCVNEDIAERIVKELGRPFDGDMAPSELTDGMTLQLTNMLKSVKIFKPPDGDCLSPAGEYNLRLGIMKELNPDYVATVSESPAAFEGHPFIVEAGVSIGGQAVKDGINVYRFANRIPLLFEGGNDVVTQVANKRIHWGTYKIDPKRDRIGVFVSIVSTKIPFKGTGKEYIGDDIEEMHKSVKAALNRCCKQLKQHLLTRLAARDSKERKKALLRYTPDVSRALATVLGNIKRRREESGRDKGDEQAARKKKLYTDLETSWQNSLSLKGLEQVLSDHKDDKTLEAKLKAQLENSIETMDLENAFEATMQGGGLETREPILLAPLSKDTELSGPLTHPVCVIRIFSSALISVQGGI